MAWGLLVIAASISSDRRSKLSTAKLSDVVTEVVLLGEEVCALEETNDGNCKFEDEGAQEQIQVGILDWDNAEHAEEGHNRSENEDTQKAVIQSRSLTEVCSDYRCLTIQTKFFSWGSLLCEVFGKNTRTSGVYHKMPIGA